MNDEASGTPCQLARAFSILFGVKREILRGAKPLFPQIVLIIFHFAPIWITELSHASACYCVVFDLFGSPESLSKHLSGTLNQPKYPLLRWG